MITADLSGKTALITGGASGIGLATATLFARSGTAIAINDVPGNPRLEHAIENLRAAGFKAIAVPGNVGQPDEARAVVEKAAHELGRLDYLINNAAMARTDRPIPPSELEAIDEDFWRDLLSLNLVGPFRCTKAAVPHLKRTRGAIVNTASTAAFGLPGSSMAYAASKAGLVSLTRSLARGLGPEVRVNAVAPGYVVTPWTARFGQEWQDLSVRQTSLKRAGTPEDIAEVMLFLCAGAGFITGQTIIADGGM